MNYSILPEKIHKNDVVLLEVYNTVEGEILLQKIQGLKVESLDKSIIDIIDSEITHDYKILIKLKAINNGETSLYVFGEGVPSLDIPIKVYENNLPKYISLNVFPDILDSNENNLGVLYLSLTDENGSIIRADKDYMIKFGTSKSGIISLDNSNMIISKGELGITQRFTTMKPGIITITAKMGDLEASELLTVEELSERTIEAVIIPKNISSSRNTNGHLIAQLFSGDNLTKATKDITVYFEFTSDSTALNTSSEVGALNPTGYFNIKKGQSWGHHAFSVQKGVATSYNATITTSSPLSIVSESFTTIDVEQYGDNEIKFQPISVLADGNRQLIGIIYLEDSNGHPVIANRDIVVSFIASDKSVSIENAMIENGFESGLVYGNMGYFVPSDTNISLKSKNSKLVNLDVHGFDKDSVTLETYQFTDTILNGEQQEIVLYMESSDGNLFKIPKNNKIEISESKIFKIEKNKIKIFPYFILIPISAIGTGDEDIVLSIGEFETTVSLSSISLKPDSLNFDHSSKLFKGIKDTFVIQILNSQGLPMEIDESIEVKIFSSDPSIIDFPKNVLISPKSSFTQLDIAPGLDGTVEISLVSEGLPIVTEEITVESIDPTIEITGSDLIQEGDSFNISILAKQNGKPLRNAEVKWEVEGGISTIADEKTGPTGEAIISIIPVSDKSIKIFASISNSLIQTASASKIVQVNATAKEILDESESQPGFQKPDIAGFDPILIVVPAIIGGVVIYMKKKKKKE